MSGSRKSPKDDKIVPLNRVEDSERWVPIPGTDRLRPSSRLKSLHRKRGNCYFAVGVSKKLFDFTYRSVVKLGLGAKTLIFSKGAVKVNNRSVSTRVSIKELDWDVGISIIIPRKLAYGRKLHLLIDGVEHHLSLMEIIVLQGLLQIASPGKPFKWYSSMAATIMAGGWKRYESTTPSEVLIVKGN
jgi:hypothetical protein